MRKALVIGPAPSRAAALLTSVGMEVRPASKMTVEKGSMRHTWTTMMATMASVVSRNLLVIVAGDRAPTCRRGRSGSTGGSELTDHVRPPGKPQRPPPVAGLLLLDSSPALGSNFRPTGRSGTSPSPGRGDGAVHGGHPSVEEIDGCGSLTRG